MFLKYNLLFDNFIIFNFIANELNIFLYFLKNLIVYLRYKKKTMDPRSNKPYDFVASYKNLTEEVEKVRHLRMKWYQKYEWLLDEKLYVHENSLIKFLNNNSINSY